MSQGGIDNDEDDDDEDESELCDSYGGKDELWRLKVKSEHLSNFDKFNWYSEFNDTENVRAISSTLSLFSSSLSDWSNSS